MNKKIFYFCLFLVLSASSVCSQITVEEEISTDSVNVFSTQNESNQKSSKIAMFSSILIPGIGHQYLGKTNSALAYISCDVLALVGAIFCSQYAGHLIQDSKGYAGIYAGVRYSGKSEKYWQAVGQFSDANYYNYVMDLNRTPEDKFTNEKQNWYWVDESFRDKYNKLRNRSNAFKLFSTCFIGAMALNRVIAFVDVRSSTKFKRNDFASVQLQPTVGSDLSSIGVSLSTCF